MTRLEDRQTLAREIMQAQIGGARLTEACALAASNVRQAFAAASRLRSE